MIFFFHQSRCEALTHFSFLVPDSSVEVFALETDEVVAGVDDATLGGDGPGCVDVIARHHPHGDARTLTLADGLGHLAGEKQQRL